MGDPSQSPAAGPLPDPGLTIWLTGLPSSGKSTLGGALVRQLRGAGRRAELLGPEVIPMGTTGESFEETCSVEVRRVGFVAHLLSRNGIVAVCALVSPFRIDREYVRRLHQHRFLEVHVVAPAEVCARRRQGPLTELDLAYEAPTGADVVVPTHRQSVEQSVQTIWRALWPSGRGVGSEPDEPRRGLPRPR